MSNFKAGDKVVCVDDSVGKSTGNRLPIHKGEVYCVRESCGPHNGYDGEAVYLVGIHLPLGEYGIERAIYSHRFRLVSEVQQIMRAVRQRKNRKGATA